MYKKIFILGTTGSGKTHLARKLSKSLGIHAFELDNILWERKYTKRRTKQECRKRLTSLLKNKSWIMDGLWTDWPSKAILSSDITIWLQPPYYLRSWRIMKRFLLNKKKKKKETFRDTMNLIKYSGRYKKHQEEDHSASYKSHREFFNKYKINFVIIRNTRQIKKLIKDMEKENSI